MYINVKVRKLTPDAVIPRYMTEGSAGFDLTATEDVIIRPHQTVLIPTGLAFEVPPGYELQIRPRSGLSRKTGLRIPNAPGTVDSDYRGEVMVIAHNAGDSAYYVHKGDRIAQGVIAPVYRAVFEEVYDEDELSVTERGSGGFGSTGNRG